MRSSTAAFDGLYLYADYNGSWDVWQNSSKMSGGSVAINTWYHVTVTRKKSLFLSPHTMVNVDGFNEIDGRKLLDELIDHSVQSKYVYKHEWTDNDIIMWDNRCTMHSVEPFDNNTIKRIMHRVTLVGENKPIPVK